MVWGVSRKDRLKPAASAQQACCKPLSQQTAGTGETQQALLPRWHVPLRDSTKMTPLPARHSTKEPYCSGLKRYYDVTKHQLPQRYSLTWCEMVQLWVLRNRSSNSFPSWLCNQNGPSCPQWNDWVTPAGKWVSAATSSWPESFWWKLFSVVGRRKERLF